MIETFINPDFLGDHTSEEDKMKKEYFTSNCAYNIYNLYSESLELQKAYNYYEGRRDSESLRRIQENSGVGSPIPIQFEFFIRTRLQALVGQFVERGFTHKAVCTNVDSLDVINEQIKIEKLSMAIEEINKINQQLANQQDKLIKANTEELIEQITKDIERYIENDWKSAFEIAANHLIEYFKYKGIKTDFKKLLEHLLISGKCHYRIVINELGQDPEIEIIDSRDLFYLKNSDKTFINECNRIVRRTFMTRQEVLAKYGHLLEKEELDYVKTGYSFHSNTKNPFNSNFIDPFDSTRYYDQYHYGHGNISINLNDILEVFHTEWISCSPIEIDDEEFADLNVPTSEFKKPKKVVRYIQHRYECTRIDRWIYTKYGRSENVLREIDKPYLCKLSYNGICLDDFNRPFSLVLATADLQDQYDLIKWKRDLQINSSGIISDKIVLEDIPTHYGDTPEQRILTHIANKKNGIDIISITQDGAGQFNNYGAKSGMQLELQQIQGLNAVLDYYKKSANEIIGVPDQMLGIIQEREAVNNVKTSTEKATIVTLPIFYTHSLIMKELLNDLLNYAKITYEEGKKGSYLLGNKQQLFKIEPDSLLADFGVQIDIGVDVSQSLKQIKDTAIEFVKAQMMEATTWTKLIGAKSIAEAEGIVNQAFKEAKENQVTQLSQQLQEAQKQLEEMNKQVQKLDADKQAIDKQRLTIEQQRVEADIANDKDTLELNKKKLEEEIRLKEKQIQAEIVQLYDSNPNNQEIVNVK